MREWIVKLTTVDGDAADALRVIEHFDTLVDQQCSALAMLRAAASLADCPVGLDDPERGLRVGVDAAGRTTTDLDEGAASRQVEQFEDVTVWLDRAGPAWPLDHLILERFARSLYAVKAIRDTDPVVAAARTACNPDTTTADRTHALRRLGLGSKVTVVATHVSDALHLPHGFAVDEHQIHLYPETTIPVSLDIAAGVHTCESTELCREWQHSVTALRVAVDIGTGRPTHVHYDTLGSIAVLVENIDAQTAAQAPDVRRLIELEAQRPWIIATLEALLGHSSIREIARAQNLHHSTMRQRIDWIELQLGYSPRSGAGTARVSTTLTLLRIATAAELAHTRSPRATAVCR